MDLLDLLSAKEGYVFKGSYREYYKSPPSPFEYDEVNAPRWSFGELINNLIRDESACVIKTQVALPWRVNGFVITQDGKAWRITEKIRYATNENKDVLRVVADNPATEWMLGMVKVDNPMELE